MSLCILIPTFERYRQIAKFTQTKIGELWRGHPEIYFCGIEDENREEHIPLKRNSIDWMGVLHDAVSDLIAKEYSACYLILDDHPPLARCHDEHLNKTVPDLMRLLPAGYIGLNGWGQGRAGRKINGDILKEHHCIEKVSTEFRWKYSLHPALWRLDVLQSVLEELMKDLDEKSRTPWAFERLAWSIGKKLPDNLPSECYRVSGAQMTQSFLRRSVRAVELGGYKGAKFLAARFFGEKAAKRIEDNYLFLDQYYEGPYPLFWSGVVQKGKLSTDLRKYLRFHRRNKYLTELEKISLQ